MWAGEHRPLRHSRGPRKPQVLPMDASRFVHFPHLDGQPRAASGPGAVGARAEAGPGRAVSAWDPASLQSLEKAPALLQKASSEMSPRRLLTKSLAPKHHFTSSCPLYQPPGDHKQPPLHLGLSVREPGSLSSAVSRAWAVVLKGPSALPFCIQGASGCHPQEEEPLAHPPRWPWPRGVGP